MYTLKSIAQRGSMLGAAAALVVAAVVPSAAVLAAELNPLTERSLLLSSSAPGYTDEDGSNYSTANPNPAAGGTTPATYAPAGSGPNGKKTGETFSFRVSSTANIKGFDFQYCTSAAGMCQAPGDNGKMVPGYDGTNQTTINNTSGDARDGVFVTGSENEEDDNLTGRPTNAQAHPNKLSDLDIVDSFAYAGAGEEPAAGEFQIYVGDNPTSMTAVNAGTWAFAKDNAEDTDHAGALTGKNNYVTLKGRAGIDLDGGDYVQVVFKASEDVYITNPGSGAFFVKMNTYDSDTTFDENTKVDGGVTVANVMTDSIHITTKVLETMSFSVGTVNRDTVNIGSGQTHGTCDPIIVQNNNRLDLGDPSAEYSLDTRKAYDTHSYWRLSSNSSGGATVYYSGNTLANTVGDEIADMPNEVASQPGTEQFGLGFVDAGLDPLDGDGPGGDPEDATWATGYTAPRSYPFKTLSSQTGAPYATLANQPMSQYYDEATGTIDDGNAGAGTAKFKFVKSSLTTPEPIAQQNEQVISCATAKMRYVANIAADTPAGVYTTKINYLAAPQY